MTALFSSNPQQQEQQQHRRVPVVELSQIHAEYLLGSGSFAAVYAITLDAEDFDHHHKLVDSANNSVHSGNSSVASSEEEEEEEDVQSRSTTSSSSSSGGSSTTTSSSSVYALKKLRLEVLRSNRKHRECASHDLTREARFLASLPEHPHIVRLYGLSHNFWDAALDLSAISSRYLILEKLDATLLEKLKQWRKTKTHGVVVGAQHDSLLGTTGTTTTATTTSLQSLELERVVQAGAMGIAQALQVLHKHKIIYRDIKPHNIGYGWDGRVKLFDFGLARQVETPNKLMTSCVGTLRYMAPEVATANQLYNTSADVYSWGVLVWEIAALEKPFHGASSLDELHQWVIQGKQRPHPRKIQSPRLRQLVTACTNRTARYRPDWNSILRQLQTICHKQQQQQQQTQEKEHHTQAQQSPNLQEQLQYHYQSERVAI